MGPWIVDITRPFVGTVILKSDFQLNFFLKNFSVIYFFFNPQMVQIRR
jgi:hypothetical protein